MFEYLPKQFSSLLGLLQNLSKDKRELKDNALRSVSHALNAIYLYYNSLSKGAAASVLRCPSLTGGYQ